MNAFKEFIAKNDSKSILIALGLFLLLIIFLKIFKQIVLHKLKLLSKKTETTLDDFLVSIIEKSVLPILYFWAFLISINTLQLNDKIQSFLKAASTVVITYGIIRFVSAAIRHSIESKIAKSENGEIKLKQVKGIMVIINIIIWSLGIIFILDNFGYDVTTLITGLGIGGIAIAFAAQNILGDLFNYFVIFFDKPFEVGDFIVIDDKKGIVENVGIKTSRIRSLTGEELIFSNSDLTRSRIHNFKRMQKRRVSFIIAVTYKTSLENLKQIPEIIKNIILSIPETEFERSHFAQYGGYSLNFETVYYVLSTDYIKYMNIQQEINLKIFEEFNKRGIEFAYPTYTVMMEDFATLKK